METILIHCCRKRYFHLKLTNYQPRITYLMASLAIYCILGTYNEDISFDDIVYFEPKNIQYKKLVNGVIDQLKVSLIHRDGNEVLSNFEISIVLHII